MNITKELEKILNEQPLQLGQVEALMTAKRLFEVVEQVRAVSLKDVVAEVDGELLAKLYERDKLAEWCEAWQRRAYEALVDASLFADREANLWRISDAEPIPVYWEHRSIDTEKMDVPNHNLLSLVMALRNHTSREAHLCEHMAGLLLDINPQEVEDHYPDVNGWLAAWRAEMERSLVNYDRVDTVSRKEMVKAVQEMTVVVDYTKDMTADELIDRCMTAFKEAILRVIADLTSAK